MELNERPITFTESDLLAELAAELTLPALQPDDVTAGRLAQEINKHGVVKSENTIRTYLHRKVSAGELIEVKCVDPATGNPITAYRKKEQNEHLGFFTRTDRSITETLGER
jgi:hypothetical protein